MKVVWLHTRLLGELNPEVKNLTSEVKLKSKDFYGTIFSYNFSLAFFVQISNFLEGKFQCPNAKLKILYSSDLSGKLYDFQLFLSYKTLRLLIDKQGRIKEIFKGGWGDVPRVTKNGKDVLLVM